MTKFSADQIADALAPTACPYCDGGEDAPAPLAYCHRCNGSGLIPRMCHYCMNDATTTHDGTYAPVECCDACAAKIAANGGRMCDFCGHPAVGHSAYERADVCQNCADRTPDTEPFQSTDARAATHEEEETAEDAPRYIRTYEEYQTDTPFPDDLCPMCYQLWPNCTCTEGAGPMTHETRTETLARHANADMTQAQRNLDRMAGWSAARGWYDQTPEEHATAQRDTIARLTGADIIPAAEFQGNHDDEATDVCPHGFDLADDDVFCPACQLRPGEHVYCEACDQRQAHTDMHTDDGIAFRCPACGHTQTYIPTHEPADIVDRSILARYRYQNTPAYPHTAEDAQLRDQMTAIRAQMTDDDKDRLDARDYAAIAAQEAAREDEATPAPAYTLSYELHYDGSPDLSYLDQSDEEMGEGFEKDAAERKASYGQDGGWVALAVMVTLSDESDPDDVREVDTASVWGIESDSDPDYFAATACDLAAELIASHNLDDSIIPAAWKESHARQYRAN